MTVRMPRSRKTEKSPIGQLAQAVGPEERAPAGLRLTRGDDVATQVTEVHRSVEKDPAFEGVSHECEPPYTHAQS